MHSSRNLNWQIAALSTLSFLISCACDAKPPVVPKVAARAQKAPATQSKDGKVSIDANKVAVTKDSPIAADINMNALHRLDFKVKGKSCAVCLFKVQGRLKATRGVVKVAVMLKKPYGGVIIYDATKLKVDQLIDTAKGDEKDIAFVDIHDEAVKKIPLILVPLNSTAGDDDNSDDDEH